MQENYQYGKVSNSSRVITHELRVAEPRKNNCMRFEFDNNGEILQRFFYLAAQISMSGKMDWPTQNNEFFLQFEKD